MDERPAAVVPAADRLAEYHAGLARGELRVTRCDECGRAEFPPRAVCPQCSVPGPASWVTASGQGHVWSFATFHKRYLPEPAPQPPYNVAVVQLVEGPRLITNIVSADPASIRVGMPVEAVIETQQGTAAVRFRPSVQGEFSKTEGR